MKDSDFVAWRRRMGITQVVAAGLLGKSTITIKGYESGNYTIPPHITILCELLEKDKVNG